MDFDGCSMSRLMSRVFFFVGSAGMNPGLRCIRNE